MEKMFSVTEEAKRVWNCANFNRRKRLCNSIICTGVYDCRQFQERNDKEDAPKKWIEFCVSVQKTNIDSKILDR